MINVKDKTCCCGCEACANICPKKCIQMQADEWGFLYPKVDIEKCINCRLCEKICPFISDYNNDIISAYAMQSRDEKILNNASSGGVFTTLSRFIIKHGGISVGAQYFNGEIKHTIINCLDDIEKHSGSKYIQSHLGNIYLIVKSRLDDGKNVLFSGTPCQVNALNSFLDKKYNNLFTVDFACAGVSSPKVFASYVEYMEKKYGIIQKINFRYKKYGYHSSTMLLKFDNNKSYTRSRLTDYMTNIWTSYIAMRPSCSLCKVKGKNRSSDITMFECWNFNKFTGKKDNNLGWTNILINTKKGMSLFDDCKEYFNVYQINADEAIAVDGNTYYESAVVVDNKNSFFEAFNKKGLVWAAKKYCNINAMSYIKEYLKPLLYKMGLLTRIKRIFCNSRC